MRLATDGYKVLARTELPLDTVLLAQYLIGKILVRETPEGSLSGRIVETEAYPVGDAAGHAYKGETLRNHALFLSPWPRLCLSCLWHVLLAQRLERDARHRSRRPHQSA